MKSLFHIIVFFLADSALASETIDISTQYIVKPNISYLRADGHDLKLDLYFPHKNIANWGQSNQGGKTALPTVIHFHGGGWVGGSKESTALRVLPFLSKGWAAVNVEYRLGPDALAPAAVEDARCALWWVKRNATRYGFDPNKIILMGISAGGHLALMAGMSPANAGFDTRCPGITNNDDLAHRADAFLPELRVAAIVNWSGITDVSDLIKSPNMKSYALTWIGGQQDRDALARWVSPITYIDQDVPPIITVHGDRDFVVPYQHAQTLHKSLDSLGVTNQLYTIRGKEHFNYSLEEWTHAFDQVERFLDDVLDVN